MRILCTNDDGIHAPGLGVVEDIARQLSDDVWVVAPELDQSGVSHSLSLNDPLRLREISERHFAVRGTPTDCVIMAARHIMKEPPDLVLSGVNRGRNTAEDVTYSGTIAGAIEGTMLGFPAIAMSQSYGAETRRDLNWDTARAFGPKVIRTILDLGVPDYTVINVNFPDCAPDDVKGVRAARQGRSHPELLRIDERHDGRGNPYYWIAFSRMVRHELAEEGSDLAVLAKNFVSVTPLKLDLTNDAFIAQLAGHLDA